MKNKFLFAFLFLGTLTFTSCDDDEAPEVIIEPEVITTLNWTLTPTISGGDVITLSFQDLDGDGGNDPVIIGGTLAVDEIYTGTLELLNESITPTEDITEEIEEEDEEHQFFFQTDISNLTFVYDDDDSNGDPVGLSSLITTGSVADSGNITLTLRHEPSKSAEGVRGGDLTNAGGETDIEVTFPIDVQ